MTDKQIIIDDYFRKIVDINGKIVDYEIKNSEVSKLVQKIEKYNSYIKLKEQECEELNAKIEYVFSDASPNFDYFCDICVAKDSCNGTCCFEQIKELIYEVE